MDNHLLQGQLSLHGSFYVNRFSDGEVYANEGHCELKTWTSSVREYSLGITGKRKSTSTVSQSEESFLTGKCIPMLNHNSLPSEIFKLPTPPLPLS